MAVVMEKRIVFTLNEVRSIIIRCVNCDGELTVVLRPERTPSRAFESVQCPHCVTTWKDTEDTKSVQEDREEAQALLRAIRHFTESRYRDRLTKREAKWEFLIELPEETEN